ncbi:hypothetical protein ABKN59_008206 [Abortiporus biennis]
MEETLVRTPVEESGLGDDHPKQEILVTNARKSPILPVELWERIIDFIADDSSGYPPGAQQRTQTLQACALTCPAWTHRSLYHLHDIVTFKTASSVKSFLLKFPPPDIPARILTIDCYRDKQHPYWVSSLPIRLKTALPLLRELSIKAFRFQNAHTQFIPSLSLARVVTDLDLVAVTFTSANQFDRLISSFRMLSLLHLHGIFLSSKTPFRATNPLCRRRAPISRLNYFSKTSDLDHFPIVLTVLHSFTNQLKDLGIHDSWLHDKCIGKSAAFVKSCKFIETLHIFQRGDDVHLSNIGLLDLSNNTNLSSLWIHCKTDDSFIPAFSSYLKLLNTTARPSQICSIYLLLAFSSVEKMASIPWGALDKVLNGGNFEELKSICFIVGHAHEIRQVSSTQFTTSKRRFLLPIRSITESTMPICHGKHLLRYPYNEYSQLSPQHQLELSTPTLISTHDIS